MKYRQYHILIKEPRESAVVKFIQNEVALTHQSLADARRIEESINCLFPSIQTEIVSVMLPAPKAEVL